MGGADEGNDGGRKRREVPTDKKDKSEKEEGEGDDVIF